MSTITLILPVILCFLCGIGLIILEVFLPGFGLPGISGIIFLVLGTWLLAMRISVGVAVLVIILLLIVLGVAIFLILRSASRGKLSHSPVFLRDREVVTERTDTTTLPGKQGVAVTALRPSGIGEFDGQRLDVVTEGDFIEKNAEIIVKSVEGNRVLVAEIKNNVSAHE